MKNLLQSIFTLLCVGLVSVTHSQTSNLSIQGVLRKANGTAVENGQYTITFKLYLAATSGDPLWTETIEDVDVEGGIYSIILGAGDTPLDASFDRPYYLGVAIEGGTELIPRARLTSSPYALSLIGDDNVFPNTGNVGVGDENPQSKLTVARDGNTLGLDVDSTGSNNAQIISKVEGLEFSTSGDAYSFEGDITKALLIKKDGKVGVGISEPKTALHVKSNAEILRLEGDDHAYLSFHTNGGASPVGHVGYNDLNDTMSLVNEIGVLGLKGASVDVRGNNSVRIDGGSGNVSISSATEITKNGIGLKLIGDTETELAFYPSGLAGEKKADIGVGEDGKLLIHSADSDIILDPGSGEEVYTKGMLYASGYESKYVSQSNHIYERYTSSTYATRSNGRSYDLSIYASKGVRGHFFVIASDKRIKKDFKLSNSEKDLSTLSKIEVTDYRHIDEIANGKEQRKGLIAQQVEAVFPEAITKSTNFIPNVFQSPASLSTENGALKIRLDKKHDFRVGDKIKVGTLNGNKEVIVSNIISPQEFSISNWQGSTKKEELFIYGKEVDDFHTVDYDRIFTLNVSATQELARKVEILEKENSLLLKEQEEMKSALSSLNDRMEYLEEELRMPAKGN